MSVRSGRSRTDTSGGTEEYLWTDWVWDDQKEKYYRYRINSKGKQVHQSTSTLPEQSTPRTTFPFSSNNNAFNSGPSSATYDSYTYYGGDPYESANQPLESDGLAQELENLSLSAVHDTNQPITETIYGDTSSSRDVFSSQPISYAGPSDYQQPSTNYGGSIHNYSSNVVMDPHRPPPPRPRSYSTYNPHSARRPQHMVAPASMVVSEGRRPSNPTYAPHQGVYGDLGDDPNHLGHSFDSQLTVAPETLQSPPEPLGVPDAISYGYTQNGTRRHIASNTPGNHERLDSRYKVERSSKFKPGHIFMVLWSEPCGQTLTSDTASEMTYATTDCWIGKHGQQVNSSIRRFVIIANDKGHSQCLPILTYNGQGTTKRGVKNETHAIIYTGDTAPAPLYGESLILDPVRMIGRTDRDVLRKESRINYAKIYTVEHNVKVLFIGWIAREFQRRVVTDFDTVWINKTHI